MVVWSRPKKSSQQWNGILPKNDKTDLSVSIFCNSVLERTPFWTSKINIRTNLPEFLRKKSCHVRKRQAFEDLAQSGMSGPEAEAQVGQTSRQSHYVAPVSTPFKG